MGQIVYGNPKIPLKVQVEHLCVHGCRPAPSVDATTGYRVGFWCKRPTTADGLRVCDICERQYIDPNKYQDSDYETNCPNCIERYGIDE